MNYPGMATHSVHFFQILIFQDLESEVLCFGIWDLGDLDHGFKVKCHDIDPKVKVKGHEIQNFLQNLQIKVMTFDLDP